MTYLSGVWPELEQLRARVETLGAERDYYRSIAVRLMARCTCQPREEITLERSPEERPAAPPGPDAASAEATLRVALLERRADCCD